MHAAKKGRKAQPPPKCLLLFLSITIRIVLMNKDTQDEPRAELLPVKGIREDARIIKSNPLLDARNDMRLTQQRMFNIYLALINPADERSKTVRFPLEDFVRLTGIKEANGKKLSMVGYEAMGISLDLCDLEEAATGKRRAAGKMKLRHLWESFTVDKDKNGRWYVQLEAHREVLPYMFGIKDLGYTPVSLVASLSLRSVITEKLYEQCLRFRKPGTFTISVEHLKERLGVSGQKAYTEYRRFKDRVLKRAVDELNKKTDIYVTVKENRARAHGSPVQSVTFVITDNPAFDAAEAEEKARALFMDNEEGRTEGKGRMAPVEITSETDAAAVSAPETGNMPGPGVPGAGMDTDVLDAGTLQSRWGFSKKEAEDILRDKEKYSLSSRRLEEVISYVMRRQEDNGMIRNPVGYIRVLLAEPDLNLGSSLPAQNGREGAACRPDSGDPVRPKSRNAFNDFEQNIYDFDALEKELLGEAGEG